MYLLSVLFTNQPVAALLCPSEAAHLQGLLQGFNAKPRREAARGSEAHSGVKPRCHRALRSALYSRSAGDVSEMPNRGWIRSCSLAAAFRGGKADGRAVGQPRHLPASLPINTFTFLELADGTNRPTARLLRPVPEPNRDPHTALLDARPMPGPDGSARRSSAPTDPASPPGAAAQRVPGAAPEGRRTSGRTAAERRPSRLPAARGRKRRTER